MCKRKPGEFGTYGFQKKRNEAPDISLLHSFQMHTFNGKLNEFRIHILITREGGVEMRIGND